jgi:aerobic C4-dicarboxylate transport protein
LRPVVKRLGRSLYFQVMVGVLAGALLGHLRPETAAALKPLGDGFIKLIRMLVGPIVFCTVVSGIAGMRDLRRVGRVGLKAIVYFEVLTTVALLIGLGVGKLVRPGVGMNVDPAAIDTHAISSYVASSKHLGFTDFVLDIIPTTFVEALVKGDLLPVLLVSVLFGVALARMGGKGERLVELVHDAEQAFFGIVGVVMHLAPLGAFGAMAFTVGKFGLGTLVSLGKLVATFYITGLLFVLVVLGLVARRTGFSIRAFIRYIGEELLIVLGTSSSESALPGLMAKLERAGCGPTVVGLVVPTGYSFNLDGTSIYLTLATVFLAQAMNIPVSLGQELGLLAILLLTSKGAATVTGGGFITLAATLPVTGHIPVAGLALLLGIDRFMSEARALTNLVGNGVATLAIAAWEKDLDRAQLQASLSPQDRERVGVRGDLPETPQPQ